MEDIQVLRVAWVVVLIGVPGLVLLAVSLAERTARRGGATAVKDPPTPEHPVVLGKEMSPMGSWSRRQDGPVTVLTLTRRPINALDRAALDELNAHLGEIERDPVTRALVITGGLDGVFCSGGDLRYWREVNDAQAVSRAGQEVFARLAHLPIPTVAAINGHVIGDGLALALACDLRIAVEEATFRLPELTYGFIPGWGVIRPLVALAGRATAADLLLTGRPLGAQRAQAIGLVNAVVSPARLLEEVLTQSRELARLSPRALAAAKCAIRGGNDAACFQEVWGGADWREGIEALFTKRSPVFGQPPRGGDDDDLSGRVQEDRAPDRAGCCR